MEASIPLFGFCLSLIASSFAPCGDDCALLSLRNGVILDPKLALAPFAETEGVSL